MRVAPEHLVLLRRMQAIWIPAEAGGPWVWPEAPCGGADRADDARRILAEAGFGEPSRAEAEALREEALARIRPRACP